MATLKDIAKELGLSPATVSRALNGFPEVNARTRSLVEETAAKLGYRPNQLAKKLVTGRSGMVGLVLKPMATDGSDPSFHEIMFGLSDQLAKRDMDLVFHAPTETDLVAPYRRLLEKNILDGFILNAPEADDPRIAFLKARGVPFVVHGRTEAPDYAFYDIDNRRAVEDAVHLLADLGHGRIAFLNGVEHHTYARERARGFRAAMASASLEIAPDGLRHGPPGEDYGYGAALSLLSGRTGPAPTAILCASVLVAAGVYRAARDLGLAIPADLSVIAHDDAVPQMRAVNFEPSLTVTRSPLRDACAPLAEAMEALLSGTSPRELQTLVAAELILRNSTAPASLEGGEA
jgi:LacI family transcriptional regulator